MFMTEVALMIEICGLTKRFGKINAVDNMTVISPTVLFSDLLAVTAAVNQHFCVCSQGYMHLTAVW